MNRRAIELESKINKVISRFEYAELKSRGGFKTKHTKPIMIAPYTQLRGQGS